MSKKSDISSKIVDAMEFVHTNPISIAIPLGVIAGIVSLSVYRYYMGSCRQPEHERKEVEMKLSQVIVPQNLLRHQLHCASS